MIIYGLDPDVHRIAFVSMRDEKITQVKTIPRANKIGRIHPEYIHTMKRLFYVASHCGAFVLMEGIFLNVGKKGQAIPQTNIDAFRRLAEVQGEVKIFAASYQVPIDVVQPSTWQCEVFGTYDKNKELSTTLAKVVAKDFGELSDHESDALCIAIYGTKVEKQKQEKMKMHG